MKRRDLERQFPDFFERRTPRLSTRAKALRQRAKALGWELDRFSRGWELSNLDECIMCCRLDDVESQILTLEALRGSK